MGMVSLFEPLIRDLTDGNAAGLADGCQVAGEIDGVAPKIVSQLLASDYAGHQRASADPSANAQRSAILAVKPANLGSQVEGQPGHGLGVVRPRVANPAGHHVSVAEGLDGFQAVLLHEAVKRREDFVQPAN